MKQSIIYTLALITLGLGSCQKPFELDSPLTPSTEQSSSSSSLAYLKAADLDYSSKREGSAGLCLSLQARHRGRARLAGFGPLGGST